MSDDQHDLFIGDPKFYTERILANPPIRAKYVERFVNLGGDKSDIAQIKAFFKSEEFLEYLCEDDYNLFAERILGYVVKPHHIEWTDLFENNKYCVVLAPREHGKSHVISSTYTMIPGKGLVFYANQAKGMAENTTIKLNEKTSVLGNELRISGFHLNSKMPTLKIRTTKGYEINCTPDHKLFLATLEGGCWDRARYLKIGDYLTLTRNTQCFGPNSCSADEAFLSGLFVGDGCNSNQKICILGDENLSVFKGCLKQEEYSNRFYRYTKKGIPYYEPRLAGRYYKPFAEKFGFVSGVTGPSKSVPQFVCGGTKEVVCNFLNGLFCADSHVNLRTHQIELVTASQTLAKQVQLLLFNLGITASINIRNDVKAFGKFGTHYYRVMINEHLSKKRFVEQIGFRFKDKQDALLEDLKCNEQLTHSSVPFANDWIRGLRKDIKSAGAYTGVLDFDRVCKNYSDGKSFEALRKVSRKVREFYKPIDSEHLKLIDFYSNPDVLFDEIESIEPSEGVTGDFEVNHPSHAMNANGFVSHNSAWLVGYVLWNAFYKKKSNILIVSSTVGQGKIILGGEFSVKEQLESNQKLASIFPSHYNRKWSETQIQLLNGVRIEVAGSDQGLRGRHPDLIICDDILSDENSGTRQAREKLVKHYSRVIVPMAKKNTQIILIGTAFHQKDLLFTLGGSSKYAFKRYQALNEETGETLWPEKHSKESLLEYKNTYGALSFQQEYQNNPLSEDLAYFTQAILDGCKDSSLSYTPAYDGPNQVHLGGDLSPPGGARGGDGDYTVFLVLEHLPDDVLNILNFVRFRDNPQSRDHFIEKQMAELTNMCLNYQVDHGFMEEVGFQAVYTKELIRRQTNLPIEGMPITAKGKRSKVAGIPYLRSLMEKGKIKLPYKNDTDRIKTDIVIEEFLGVSYDENGKIGNMGYHDDIVTAMWMAVESTKMSGRPVFTIPYDRYASKSKHLHIPRFRMPRRPFKP